MKWHPCPFSAPMMRALLNTKPGTFPPEPIADGPCKGVTRRLMRPQPTEDEDRRIGHIGPELGGDPAVFRTWLDRSAEGKGKCEYDYNPEFWRPPHGVPGDGLWCREAWCAFDMWNDTPPRDIPPTTDIWYMADGVKPKRNWTDDRWGRRRPGMFMPRWASRENLLVRSIVAERVGDITEEQAIFEGVEPLDMGHALCSSGSTLHTASVSPIPHGPYRRGFCRLWNSLHPRLEESFEASPWVFRTDFTRMEE